MRPKGKLETCPEDPELWHKCGVWYLRLGLEDEYCHLSQGLTKLGTLLLEVEMAVRAIIPDKRRDDSSGYLVVAFHFQKPIWVQEAEPKIIDFPVAWFESLKEAQKRYPEAYYYAHGYKFTDDELVAVVYE
jgi:hypothetical protein